MSGIKVLGQRKYIIYIGVDTKRLRTAAYKCERDGFSGSYMFRLIHITHTCVSYVHSHQYKEMNERNDYYDVAMSLLFCS